MSATILESSQLHTPCTLEDCPFESSAELPDLDESLGQSRAVEALRFGLGMPRDGFNLFVLGGPGSGRHALVRNLVDEVRRKDAPPSDYCYVNNFAAATAPRLLRLPAGRGARLRDDMLRFVAELGPAIATAFESEEYRARVGALEQGFKDRQESVLRALGNASLARGVALVRSESGFAFLPVREGTEEPLSEEEFENLPDAKKETLQGVIEEFQEPLIKVLAQFPAWRRELQDALKDASREVLRNAVVRLLEKIKANYADLPAALAFLQAVEGDVVEIGDTLRESRKSEPEMETLLFSGTISIQRYLVNLLVDNAASASQPVVYETHPTFQNLVGRIENVPHMGTLVSNFTLIRAGALHRANGGYLILDALKLLSQPYAWEGLKRALCAGEIRIEAPAELIGVAGMVSTLQLQPEPAPLKVKVILIGEPMIYYLLAEMDAEFADLFKVAADFAEDVPRTAYSSARFACLTATLARQNGLKPLALTAVTRVVEHAARLSGDAERLTTLTRPVLDLLHEADYLAGDAAMVSREHIERALAAQIRRADRLRERYYDAIRRGTLLISTAGELIGQVNGLAAVGLGDFTFAHPVRLSAAVRIGDGEMIDIEREVEMGGPIHSKGVMILAGFFSTRFGRGIPLSFTASIVFEQTYGEVEGDSASLAELCALLSAIGALPVRQGWAITGSVNQYGAAQPIGAVNEKIEGFFDICAAGGLSGEQGVIIPAANVKELMLKREVVEAVAAGRFRVAAVAHVDEAIELLTGLPIGEADEKGVIAEGTINYLVASSLVELHASRLSMVEVQKVQKKRARAPAKKKRAPQPPAPGK
ncbi:MAG: AAA family ATPase [Betaproteobacteria bacterium]|nr:AAA family ATPase [Betaproteobacteria bacterium]